MFIEDPLTYRLHILVKGLPEIFDFEIECTEGERVQRLLEAEDDEGASAPFICFRCKDETQVALNVDDIELVNYRWDTGRYVNNVEGDLKELEEFRKIIIYFQGRPEPYESDTEIPDEFEVLFEELALDPFVKFRFLSYTDGDGELVTFRAEHVAMMLVKREWVVEEE